MDTVPHLADAEFQALIDFDQWQPKPAASYALELNCESALAREPSVSVVIDAETKRICSTCNGFATWWLSWHGFPSSNDIYLRRLDACFGMLVRQSKYELIQRPLLYLMPTYSGWNFGHDLSVILMTVLAFRRTIEMACESGLDPDQLVLGVSLESIKKSPNSLAVLNAFVPHNKIINLTPGVPYKFESLIPPPSCFFHLHREDLLIPIIGHLVRMVSSNPIIRSLWDQIIAECGGKFVLCKRVSHLAVRSYGIMPEWVEQELRQHGWFVIDVEKIPIMDIVYLLHNSKQLLFGSGAVQYAHKIFASRQARIHLLFDQPNYPAYNGHEEILHGIPEHLWAQEEHWHALLNKLA